MSNTEWTKEPDLDELRRLYGLLQTNPEEGRKGLESLAARGSMMSSWYLAEAYTGTYLPKDLERAKHWYASAANLGSAEAAFALGSICQERGSYEEALGAFSRSAALGYLPATYRLATMYIGGVGTNIDLVHASELLADASSRGHLFARRDLGRLYLSGAFGARFLPKGIALWLSTLAALFGLLLKAARHGPAVDDRLRG